jgi:hypothetical protein
MKVIYNKDMKKPLKKTALFMIIFGCVVLIVSGYFSFKEYQVLSTAIDIQGTVTKIITLNSGEDITYKPEISYQYNNMNQVYTPNYSSTRNNYVVGDPVVLSVSEKGTRIKGLNQGIIALALSLLTGLIFFIIGLKWLRRDKRDFDDIARLKRYGTRVQARFIKQESSVTIGNQPGVILFLQEEDSNRVFNTKPIHSEFSIKWLEEHSFDVYVDPRNSLKYFVDIEKHFGHPQINK